ncbi:MAG TPA: hypothetical protein PKH79_07380 [Prolixibacteraceae bacterium]|nr:hypothetical protein [Prolixibacteraceae bacterium]
MRELFILLFSVLLLFSSSVFSQKKPTPVVIKKNIEVVEYDYNYIYVEFISSAFFSANYPMLILDQPTLRQQSFEQGRNIRPGYEIGMIQRIKMGAWALSTGLSFQNYNEHFSYNEYTFRQVTIQAPDGTAQSIQIAEGDPVSKSHNNDLNYLKIPFIVSFYPTVFKERISINIEGNYSYLVTSSYLAKFSVNEPVKTIARQEFNPSLFSIGGSVCYHQKIFRNNFIDMEPFFKIGLNKIIDSNNLNFRINTIGLKTSFSIAY